MSMKTFRQASEELGVSRTTLQGWVRDILGKPARTQGKAQLFSEEDMEKLRQIRFLKQLGENCGDGRKRYTNSRIREIINDPGFDLAGFFREQLPCLEEKKREVEKLIGITEKAAETGVSPQLPEPTEKTEKELEEIK